MTDRENSAAYAALPRSARRVFSAIETAIGDGSSASVSYVDFRLRRPAIHQRISRGASQREAVDGIDGVLREARRWSAKVIAAVGIIPVPLYFLGRNENVFPVLPALRIDLAVDRFDFGRVAVRIVATAERRIIRHVPRRIKPLMQRPILSGMVAISGLVLLTFLRMDERCQQASAREEELAKKVQGAVSLLTTAKWCAISG